MKAAEGQQALDGGHGLGPHLGPTEKPVPAALRDRRAATAAAKTNLFTPAIPNYHLDPSMARPKP
jgi:hypothetical protein